MKVGVVIPYGPGREDNLRRCLSALEAGTMKPGHVVIVCDGPEATIEHLELNIDNSVLHMPRKHNPGMEQPRNVGVRLLSTMDADFTHVWFLDTDIIVARETFMAFQGALEFNPQRILVGPYDWMSPEQVTPQYELFNDPRWVSFREHEPDELLLNDLSAGLACFSGNLIWPIDKFTRIGGFWNELHHGRAEDGELGLRAVSCDIPISFIRDARGWHMDHPINGDLTLARNERDVPMLNARHPWVQGNGLFVVEEDGKRFNVRCPCGWEGNTLEIWRHQAACPEAR